MKKKVETVNIEPNWVSVYAWFMKMKQDDTAQFEKMKAALGANEWARLESYGNPEPNADIAALPKTHKVILTYYKDGRTLYFTHSFELGIHATPFATKAVRFPDQATAKAWLRTGGFRWKKLFGFENIDNYIKNKEA